MDVKPDGVVAVVVGWWIGAGVFEGGGARDEGGFVRALAAGCVVSVVECVLFDEMTECWVVAKGETGVVSRVDWMSVKVAAERAGKMAVD